MIKRSSSIIAESLCRYGTEVYSWRETLLEDMRHTGEDIAGLILGLRPANERRCYFLTTSLIGWNLEPALYCKQHSHSQIIMCIII